MYVRDYPRMLREAVFAADAEHDPVSAADACHAVWADLLARCDWHPIWPDEVEKEYGIDPDETVDDWRAVGLPESWVWRGWSAWVRPNGRVLSISRRPVLHVEINVYDPADLSSVHGMIRSWEWSRMTRPFRGTVAPATFTEVRRALDFMSERGATGRMSTVLLEAIRGELPPDDTGDETAWYRTLCRIVDLGNPLFDADASFAQSGNERVVWCWDSSRIMNAGGEWRAD